MRSLQCRFAVLMFLFLFTRSFADAQPGKLPPFQMVQANGKVFRAQNLPIGKPVLVIYFSPECDHCERMLKAFFKQAADFKKASVALITFLPVDKVSKFAKDYNLAKHPNMVAGTEGSTFFVRNYYRINELPFVALYTKNGDFVSAFEKDIDLKALAEKMGKLP